MCHEYVSCVDICQHPVRILCHEYVSCVAICQQCTYLVLISVSILYVSRVAICQSFVP